MLRDRRRRLGNKCLGPRPYSFISHSIMRMPLFDRRFSISRYSSQQKAALLFSVLPSLALSRALDNRFARKLANPLSLRSSFVTGLPLSSIAVIHRHRIILPSGLRCIDGARHTFSTRTTTTRRQRCNNNRMHVDCGCGVRREW